MNFFFSVIDTHNHFRPFSGPAVPFDTYFQWMAERRISPRNSGANFPRANILRANFNEFFL